MTQYLELLDAVAKYYGAGSDQWMRIATSSDIRSADWYNILSETPGVNVTVNEAGQVIDYSVSNAWGTATDAATSAINSNAAAAEYGSSSLVNIPANTTVNQAGNVVAESGFKSAATGLPVKVAVKDVVAGVGAVAAGIQMGSLVSQLAYQHDPQLWNRAGFSTFNPQAWSKIIANDADGNPVLDFVFGVDQSDNSSVMYMREDALAYMAGYLNSIGAYETYKDASTIDDTSGLNLDGLTLPLYSGTMTGWTNYAGTSVEYQTIVHVGGSNDSVKLCGVYNFDPNPSNFDTGQIVAASETPFYVTSYSSDTGLTISDPSQPITFNGKSFYIYKTDPWFGFIDDPQGAYNETSFEGGVDLDSVAYVLLYGTDTYVSGKKGFTQQPGATLPVLPATTDINAIIQALKQQYPDLWTDAITNDVVQPDGSIDHHIYVPVPIPDHIRVVEEITEQGKKLKVEPTSSEKTKQGQEKITEETDKDIVDTLIDIMSSTKPGNPTKTPTDTSGDYPDTGDGTTPTVVIPTGSASALYSIYNPTQSQLNSLGSWLWSSNFVDQLLKVFNDPMQAIIGLHKVFVSPPVSGTGNIKVGYLDSGVSSNLVSAQYTEVDCGSVNVREYFGNTLDYTDTDVMLYLPFIGIVPLNVADVMRGTVNVKYKVDVLTGACLAQVNITRDGTAGGQIYVYSGNCAVQYPLSSGSYMGILSGALGIAASVVTAIGTGGAAVPLALGAGASALSSMKTHIEHSGSLSGNAGAMGIKKPYFIFRRPQTKIAFNYAEFAGSDENMNTQLLMLTGYVQVKHCHLENIPATDQELTEIEDLLKTGIYI